MKSANEKRKIKVRWKTKLGWEYWEFGKDITRLCYANKETLGQWTGLKTEDGTEIYEGDVVRAGSMCESPHIGVVQFCPDLGGYIVWDEWESGMGFNQLTIHEVIGNIYDDPSLKKKYWKIYSK